MATTPPALKFLSPAWFSIVMGLCGLSLAWHRAVPLMGDLAGALALVLGLAAAGVFVLLLLASGLRLRRHPAAWAADLRHPVRHGFVAMATASLILLATVDVALAGPGAVALWLWRLGALAHGATTLWVLARWWRPAAAGGLAWPMVTPVLIVAVVGNVLAPLAGVALGQAEWSAAQFGVGLLFWPVLLVLLAVRLLVNGAWPDRLLPSNLILVAPPAVVGLSALQLGAPPLLGWALWGMALFTLLWVGTLARRILAQPFGLPHWGMSFPLAALAALTLRLATPGGFLAALAPALLALVSLVVLGLLMATARGLRDGSLLAPEPVAAIVPVARAE